MEISKQLTNLATSLGVKFSFNGKPLSYEEVFSSAGLLPGMARRADQLCSLCLGYGIGVSFEDAEKAPLGIQVKFDAVTPQVLRLLCITDVIMELRKASSSKEVIALDELMYD